jgi:tRNA G18 (ribose-2'-O)-methylase SpoU
VTPIDSLDDPRVSPYRNLKDRELARLGDRFIAESEMVVRRLLASPTHRAESVLCTERKIDEIAAVVPAGVELFVAADRVIHGIVGYKFHSGVMAVGVRPRSPTVEEAIPPRDRPCLVLVCPQTANAENLGSLIRLAAGFGCDAVLLGEECCDPYYRQCVRVSMGTVFALPIVRSNDIRADLRAVRVAFGVENWATVLDANADRLGSVPRPARLALLVGNEAQGLERDVVALCDRRVIIPMRLGTDSLNVAVATGVFLWELTKPR